MDLLKCGYTLDDIETARPEDMERYYPPEPEQEGMDMVYMTKKIE